ncbi:MAG: efflux RND transporter periplasmic adaptor subunit [Chloroflexota bacterium]
MRRIIVIVVGVIVVAAIAFFFIGGRSRSTPTPGAAGAGQATVRKITIDKGDLKLTVSATGNVVANQESNLSFEQPARVQEVLVEEGQKVDAGQVLARQEDSTQKLNLSQADYSLKATEAALQKLLRPVDAGDVANAEANVKAAQASYSSMANSTSMDKINALQLQYQQALANQQGSTDLRKGAGGQYDKDDPNFQQALAQEGQASFDAESARLRLASAKNGRSLVQATARIAQAQAQLAKVKAGPTQAQIDTAQAQVVVAKLARDQAQHQLDKTLIKAPYAGYVTSVSVKAGEVSSGTAMVLTDNSVVYIDVNVDEVDIGHIQVGQLVEFTVDALQGVTLTGKVTRITQLADETATVIKYVVRVNLDPTKAPIKVTMTTNATFLVREVKNVVRVPNQYVRVDRVTNQATVNLVNASGALTEVPIKLGLQGSDYSEVIEGLNEGDTIGLGVASSAPTSN